MNDAGSSSGQITDKLSGITNFINEVQPRIDEISAAMTDLGKGLYSELIAVKDSLVYSGEDIVNIMSAGIDAVPPFIGSALKAEAENINNVIQDSNQGIQDFVESVPTAFDPYLIDSKSHDGVIDRFVRYIKMYMSCGFKLFTNSYYCLMFYMVDVIFETIKLFVVVIPIFLVGLVGIDISKYYDILYDQLVYIDDMFLEFSGYHLFFYSDIILDMCYHCDGIPHKGRQDNPLDALPVQPVLSAPEFPPQIQDSINELSNTYNNSIPKQMKAVGRFLGNSIDSDMEVSDSYTNAANNMKSGFNGAISTASDHFRNDIPGKFAKAMDEFNNVGAHFNAAFAPM